MRRKIRKDIKNMIQTMLEAHNHVTFLLQNKRIREARDLLSQCQECAVYIGESIEKNEGMDTQAVSYLETYCEQLYNMSRCIDRKRITGLKRQLDAGLYHVVYEIDEEFPSDKLKVVFMPYNASMWDCMESVWEAAAADEHCEAYVVPIPYYERDKNGEMQKECYDGDAFPDYVPIIHYKDFSLERESPDIIYIHNPYDEANYVTSVHPDYYSSKLKSYTTQLVYIPYYITGKGAMDEAHRNLPAYNYVDKIIVQDEEKAESLFDYIPADKVVVLGSPKADRILKLNERKEEIIEHSIPREWREKIHGKKVILFNISISGILKNSKYALDKIRYVLSKFEHREEIVLLWRPHPLVEATLKSMRPEMYEEYMKIKNLFIGGGKGIFDETEDAGISVTISDAYLGEATSSLVHYFGVLGKPVLYTNWEMFEEGEENRNCIKFDTYFIEKDEMYFVPANKGYAHILFKLNLENGIVERVMEFPGNPDNVEFCYYGIKKIQNKILLIPYHTEDIYVYDIDRKQAIKIVLPLSQDRSGRFNEAIEYKDKLFLMPGSYPAIISIDMQNYEVREFQECIKPFLLKNQNISPFSRAYLKKEQYLYLAGFVDSKILIFNMEDNKFVIKRIGNYSYGYGHMIYDGENFWLSAYRANRIVRWNEESENTEEYTYPVEEDRSDDEIWSLLLDMEDEIAICCGSSVDMIFMNKKTGKCRYHNPITNILNKIEGENVDCWDGFVSANFLDEKTAVMLVRKNSSVNIWDTCTDEWKSYLCRLPKEEILRIEKRQIEKYGMIRSTPYSLSEDLISISQFADYIVSGDTEIFKQTYECYQGKVRNSTIGASVHEYIKKLLE